MGNCHIHYLLNSGHLLWSYKRNQYFRMIVASSEVLKADLLWMCRLPQAFVRWVFYFFINISVPNIKPRANNPNNFVFAKSFGVVPHLFVGQNFRVAKFRQLLCISINIWGSNKFSYANLAANTLKLLQFWVWLAHLWLVILERLYASL